MMKGFVSVFKMLGLAILATGLMMSGCAAPTSDEADAVQGAVDQGAFAIPVTVNPSAHSLTFGDGSNSASAAFDGHTVEIQTIGCAGPDTSVTCTLRVINRDTNEFMTNATLFLSYCVDCSTSPNFSNADCTGLDSTACNRPLNLVDPLASGGNSGLVANTPIGQVNGYCLAEDGKYQGGLAPYTVKGCLGHQTVQSDTKPAQHIAPACGYRDLEWDFATTSGTHFVFYASVVSQWNNIDLTADSRVLAADFDDYTTLVLQIVDLDDPGIDIGAPMVGPNWKTGSNRHSTVLAGIGNNTTTLSQGKYFALNIDAEYPNRIELYSPGRAQTQGFTDYEYYVMYNFVIRFDPAIVSPYQGGGGVPLYYGSATTVDPNGQPQCQNCVSTHTTAAQRRMFDSVTSLEDMGSSNSVTNMADKGIVYAFVNINTSPFTWNAAAASGAAQTYYETDGAFACARLANMWPINAGQHGLIHLNRTTKWPCTNRLAPTAAMLKTTAAEALENDGIDAAPEMQIGMWIFKVQPVAGGSSPVGLGTMFWPEQHSNNAGYVLAWTGGTAAGGSAVGSDDWINYCYPFNMPNMNNVQQGCPAVGTAIVIGGSGAVEQSNPHMTQTGFSTPGNGVYMANTVSFCVSL